ncbi:MAG: LON peptidase substrate-binding domain-containing protein, partial [Myxococcota bacterium]
MSADSVALPLRGMVVLPGMIRIMPVGRETSIAAIQRHWSEDVPLVLVPQIDPEEEDPRTAAVATAGVSARVLRLTSLPDGTLRVLVEGLERVHRTTPIDLDNGATVCGTAAFLTRTLDGPRVRALSQELAQLHQEHNQGVGLQLDEHWTVSPGLDDPERLVDHVLATTQPSLAHAIALLEESVLDRRVELVIEHLSTQVARHRIAGEVHQKVQRAMDESQREYHLKEQLKAIRAELGESTGAEADVATFEKRLREAGPPPEVEKEAMHELDRLRRVHSDSAEYTVIRTWLETVCDVPWSKTTTDTSALKKAERVLDRDHYGLERVKERLIEYLAVR